MSEERSKEWVLERVKKLLTLGRDAGATDGERDNAMRMAHKLLAKYNLDMAEAEAIGQAEEARIHTKVHFYGRPWAKTIAVSIAKLYFCEYVFVTAKRADDVTHYFFGRPLNVQAAASIAAWLVKSVRKEARSRCPLEGEGANAWIRSFCTGVSLTIYKRVAEMMADAAKQTAAPGMSLVLASVYEKEKAKNLALRDATMKTTLKGHHGKRLGDADAIGQGKEYGKSINLNRQVGGSVDRAKLVQS